MAFGKEDLEMLKTKRTCNIVYMPLSGGNLIAQILSTGFNNKAEHYSDLYTNNNEPWVVREYKFGLHPEIGIRPSFQLRFKDLLDLNHIVYIDITDKESMSLIKWRNEFIHQFVMNLDTMDLHEKYHNEMQFYLQRSNVPYLSLRFYDFFNRKIFPKRIMQIAKILKIKLDKSVVTNIHNAWLDNNEKLYADKENNKYEDIWNHWQMKDKYF